MNPRLSVLLIRQTFICSDVTFTFDWWMLNVKHNYETAPKRDSVRIALVCYTQKNADNPIPWLPSIISH